MRLRDLRIRCAAIGFALWAAWLLYRNAPAGVKELGTPMFFLAIAIGILTRNWLAIGFARFIAFCIILVIALVDFGPGQVLRALDSGSDEAAHDVLARWSFGVFCVFAALSLPGRHERDEGKARTAEPE